MNIGFIGLGLMGRPMALHLARAGHTLHLWARRAAALEPFRDVGAHAHLSAAEVARHADIVFTMVADVPDVEEVMFGAGGVAAGARPGLVVIDMSTLNPGAARSIGSRLEALGIEFLDAPVSGGEVGAINATLTIMVGGKPAVFERARPLFEKLGKSVTLVGDSGAGQVAKACNQILTGVGVVALAEACNFSRKSGVDFAPVREALLGGFAWSKILEHHGGRMVERNFKPGFKAWMHQKDLRTVMTEAHRLGVMLPTAAAAMQIFNAIVGSGMGEEDSVAALKLFENMSGGATAAMPTSAAPAQASPAAKTSLKIGFIGLGTMGQPMTEHLLRAGHTLHVWNRPHGRSAASADALVAQGAIRHDSPAALAWAVDIACTNVTGSADVEALALGPDGIIEGLAAGAIHIDFSTIAPAAARRIAAAYAARGIEFVDAPVSGGGAGARAATLAIMWGGKSALAIRLAPLFSVLGKTAVHVGAVGAGQVAKACNQMVMVATIAATAEAARLANASGVDFGRVREAMLGGSAGSRVLEVFGERMARRDFVAGVEARLHHKDFALLMDEATRIGAPLPIAAQVWQMLNGLMGHGWGKRDTACLLEVLEGGKNAGSGDS